MYYKPQPRQEVRDRAINAFMRKPTALAYVLGFLRAAKHFFLR